MSYYAKTAVLNLNLNHQCQVFVSHSLFCILKKITALQRFCAEIMLCRMLEVEKWPIAGFTI